MKLLIATLALVISMITNLFDEYAFVPGAYAAVVQPEKPNSVLPYRNNEKAMGKYTFFFKIGSSVDSNPLITIDFPSTYPSIVPDIENCKGRVEVLLRSEVEYMDCTVFGNQIMFDLNSKWTELDAGNIIIDLYDVVNPDGIAVSTGNFAVRTWSGQDIVIDNNVIFQGIGFAKYYAFFPSVSIVNDGANIAGYVTNYVATFEISETLPIGSWFRLEFPAGFGFGDTLDCYVEEVGDDVAPLPCHNEGMTLMMKDLKFQMNAGTTYKIKMRNIRNPFTATPQTGSFVFETMKEGVNTVIEYEGAVPGILISPGAITETTVIGFPLVQNLYVDYYIKFLPQNTIPEGGMIEIDFPDTYQGLDTSCRIISGLEQINSTELIDCSTTYDKIWIKNFAEFDPKYIEVKVFATNPPFSGETPHWQIRTYQDETATQIIDENPQAGTLPISSIDRPNFFAADLYEKIVNCSWLERCPIDFRFFPNPGAAITKYNSNTNYGNLALQIPLWWWLYSNSSVPECKIGDDPSSACHDTEHIYSIRASSVKDYEYCELPVSVKYARMTPIPGKYPFRILSFQNGGKWYPNNHYKQPEEQDTYIMDIPIVSISVLQTYAAASESGDVHNMLHIRSNIHPFLFSYEGTITVNVSNVYNSYDDSAAWPLHMGMPGVADNSWKDYPCKVYIYNRFTGYYSNWDYHPDVRCYIRTGDLSGNTRTQIQIVGFGRNLEKGNYFEFFLPRVAYCQTVGRKCKVTVAYTMTHDLDYPYITNKRENDLGVVNPPPTSWIDPKSTTPSIPSRSREKCRPTSFYMYSAVPQPIRVGDYIIATRVLSHWNFTRSDRYNFRYETGNDQMVVPILDWENDIEYLVVWVTEEIPATAPGGQYRFWFHTVTNSPYADNEAWFTLHLWSNRIKIVSGALEPTLTSTPGGIHYNERIYEDALDTRHYGTVGAIAGYHRPAYIGFRNCMNVPEEGEIKITFNDGANNPLNNWGSHIDYCRVWRNVNKQYANETHVRCDYDDTTHAVSINTFDTIMNLTYRIAFSWSGKLKDVAIPYNVGAMGYSIETFNVTGDASTRTDWLVTGYNTGGGHGTNGVGLAGFQVTKKFPPHRAWHKFRKYQYEIYRNLRGSFIFDIEVGDLMEYTAAEDNYFEFVFDDSITLGNHLECRYAAYAADKVTLGHHYPSVDCNMQGPGHVQMKLHPYLDIHAATRYQFIIDSRLFEMWEGWDFTEPGIYTLSVNSFLGGVATRSQKQRFEVYGERIPHFFIYQANRVIGEPGLYIFWSEFFNPTAIRTSDETAATYWTLAAFFETANNGFAQDLGTGWPDQSQVPCKIHYLGLLPNYDQVLCYIYYGYNDSPARIEAKGFGPGNSRFIRLDIPGIVTPVTPGLVPRTWFKVLETVNTAGNKVTTTRWEGHYYELNNTWGRYDPWYGMTTATDTTAMSQNTNDLDTVGNFQMTLRTPYTLHENDYIIIKFPKFWPVPYQMSFRDCKQISVKDENCFSIRNTPQDYHIVYNRFGGGGLTDGDSVTLTMESPRATITANNTHDYIETFLYHDGRLVGRYQHTNIHTLSYIPDVIVPTINCIPTDPIQFTDTEYLINFALPHDLLSKSEIRIDYPDYDLTTSITCSSTTNSMLTGQVACDIIADPDRYSSTYNFNAPLMDDVVEIKLPLKNPAQGAAPILRPFQIRTYYIHDNGYYYMNGDSGMIDHADNCKVLASPAVTSLYWPEMFHHTDRTRCGETGPLLFLIETGTTLTQNTPDDYIEVRIPLDFVKSGAEFVAQWNEDYASSWTLNSDATHYIAVIRAPKTKDINANERYTMNITTLNGLRETNGFIYPANQGTYFADIKVFKAGVLVEEGNAKIFAFQADFENYESKSYLMNAGYRASFLNTFVPGAALPANGKFIFKLPTTTYKYKQRVNLFDDDAGRGYNNGDTVSCHCKIDGTYEAPNCLFYKGSQENGLPARVEMTNLPAIGAAALVELTFDGFAHPAIGDDNKNVEASVEFHDNGGNHLFTGIDYDYTIVTDTTFDQVSGYAEPTFDSNVIGTTNTGMVIQFRTPVTLTQYQAGSGVGWADYLIIEFPVGFVVRVNDNADAELITGPGKGASNFQKVHFSAGNNWVIWKVDINSVTANSFYELRIRNVDQAKSIPADSRFKMLIVKDRKLIREITYDPMTTLTPPAILPSEITLLPDEMAPGNIPRDKYQRWRLDFNHAAAFLPTGGAFQIVIPTSLAVTDTHCYNTETSTLAPATGNDIFCKWDAGINGFIVTNYADSGVGDKIELLFYATSENTSPGSADAVVITAFKDEARTFQILEGTVNVPALSNFRGFKQLRFTHQDEEIPDVIRASESNYIDLDISIPTGWGAGSSFTVTFDNGITVPADAHMNCQFGVYEASRCEITNAVPLVLTVYTPHQPALVPGDQYVLRISSTCGAANARGLQFPAAAGNYFFDVQFGASTYRRAFKVYAPDFTTKKAKVLYSNKLASNAIAIGLKLQTAIPAGGKLRFKLPRMSKGGKMLLWSAQGTEEGEEKENTCRSVSPTVLIPTNDVLGCWYYQEGSNNVWEMYDFNSLINGATFEFVIYGITNTDVTGDNYIIDAIVESVDASGNILNQGVLFDIFAILDRVATTSGPSNSLNRVGANNLYQLGVTYRFQNIVISPALEQHDQVVFEFDSSYFHPAALAYCAGTADGDYTSYGKYVVFQPTDGTTVSGTVEFCFTGGQNPYGNIQTTVAVYAVYSRGYTKKVLYNTPAHTLGASSVTAVQTVDTVGGASKYTLTVSTNVRIPSYGVTMVSFPADFTFLGAAVRGGLNVQGNTIWSDVSGGFMNVYIKNRRSWNGSGNIVLDVYVVNGAALTDITVTAHATDAMNSQIFLATTPAGLAVNAGTTTTCEFTSAPLSGTIGAAMNWNLNTPAAEVASLTNPGVAGYELITYVSAAGACQGVSAYASPAGIGGAITIGHTSVTSGNNYNYIKWVGNVPAAMTRGKAYFSVDFGNHDVLDLGTGLVNGAAMPCQLNGPTGIVLATCRLRHGNQFMAPGIEVWPIEDIASGTAHTLVVSRFRNPSTVRDMEVRVRFLYGTKTQYPRDVYTDTQTYTIAADVVTANTGTADFTGTSAAQEVVTADFTFAGANTVGDSVMVFTPLNVGGKDAYTNPPGFDESYPSAGLYISTGSIGGNIITADFELPVAATNTDLWIAVNVDTMASVNTYDLTPTAVGTCTVTFTDYSVGTKNDVTGIAQYRFRWTSNCDHTAGTHIDITLPAYVSNAEVGKFELTRGTVIGNLAIKTDGVNKLTATGFDLMKGGDFELTVWVKATIGGGATTASFQAIAGAYTMFEDTSIAMAMLATNSINAPQLFRDYIPYKKAVRVSGFGYLSLEFQTVLNPGGTNKFWITPPTLISQPKTHIRCKFIALNDVRDSEFLSSYCKFDQLNKRWEIQMPESTTLVNSQVYRLEIYTVGESYSGLVFPSSVSAFNFDVKLVTSGGATREQFVTDLIVNNGAPAMSCFKNFLSNTGLKNVFMMRFEPQMAIPSATGFVELHFPTTVMNNDMMMPSFEKDLGTGLFNEESIKCQAWTYAAGVKTAWGGVANCKLIFGGGSNQLHRSAYIDLELTANMATGTTYVVDFYGIVNPALAEVLTELRLLAGEYISGIKSFTNVMFEHGHIYTSTVTATVEGAQTLPGIAPTTIQTATNFDLAVNTGTPILLNNQYDHIRLIYNSDMYNPAIDATDFESFDIENGLAYFYTETDQTTNFNLQLSDMNTPDSAKPVFLSDFKVQVIKNKVIVSEISYGPGGNSFVAEPWTTLNIVPPTENTRQNDKRTHTLNLVLSKKLKATGSIEIETRNMASVDPYCTEITSALGNDYTCVTVSPTILRISAIKELPIGTNIQINMVATAAGVSTGEICATAWEDAPAVPTGQTDAVQLESCSPLTYSGVPALPWWEARTPLKRWRIQAEERGVITLKFDTGGATVAKELGYVRVNDPDNEFGTIDTRDYYCFFDDFVSTSCLYSNADRAWYVYAPRNHDLTGIYTLVIKPWRQEIEHARGNGVVFPLQGDYPVTLTGHTGAGALVFTDPHDTVYVPPWKFELMEFNSYLVKIGTFTTMHAKITANRNIAATTAGQIKIDFKIKNRYGHNVFTQDVGTGYFNGQDYDCPTVPANIVKCRIFWGNDNTPASIIMDPQAAIPPGDTFDVDFPSLFNPIDDFTEVKILITAQNFNGGTQSWDKQSEYLNDIYVAIDSAVTPTLLPAPAIADKRTGALNAVTWTFTTTTTVKDPAVSFDKIVLLVDKAVLEHIVNTKPMPTPQLTCPGFTYKIFPSVDMIEFTPNSEIVAGTTVNLACTNFYTPQYVIRDGMKFLVEVWIDGQVDQIFEYGNILYTPNILLVKNVEYASEPNDAETGSFESYTFTFKPTNYIRIGGKIEIYFDQDFSGMTNCKLVAGLNGGVCKLLDNFGGEDIIRIENFQLYYPETDPDIVVQVDMTNVPTARTVDFRYRSIWKQDDLNPLLEDLIDDDLIETINYVGLTPYTYLNLEKMYMYTREACWHRDDHGTFQFEIAFSSDIIWTEKFYIMVYPWNFDRRTYDYSRDPYISEFLCYFDTDDIKFSSKSEHCYYDGGILYIWPPEETDLLTSNRMLINIDWRGQRDRGVSTWIFPKQRHLMVYTDSTTGDNEFEVGPLHWQQRACYWGNRDYQDTDWHADHIHSIQVIDHAWQAWNSGMTWTGRDHRIQLQYSIFNEMKQTSYENLGFDDLTALNDTKRIPCMYTSNHDTLNWPTLIWSWDEICEVYRVKTWDRAEDGYGLGSTAVMTFNNITRVVRGDEDMRWGIPGMRNYIQSAMPTANDSLIDMGIRNTFTHATIQSQVALGDGIWWDTHRSLHWYHIDHILNPHGHTPVTGASTLHDLSYGQIHITQYLDTTPPSNHGFSFLYYTMEDPWYMHYRNQTHGSRYCRTRSGTNLRCLLFDKPFRWVVYRVPQNNGIYAEVRHFGMMQSPSFCIEKPYWVYLAHATQIRYILTGTHSVTCVVPNVIPEMELRDNPEDIMVYYRIGVLPFRYEPWIKYFRFWIPEDFAVVGPHCRVNFGFRIQSIQDFGDKMKCKWSTDDFGSGDYHHLEFYDVMHWSRRWWDQYDAMYIFDMDLKNPDTPKWTQPWRMRSYDNYSGPTTNLTRENLYLNIAHDRPRTWVGKNVPVANYFRVFRNRETHEERRLLAGGWGELHLRIYPKNVIPADVGKVEVQLPTDYDIPNGGTKICEVGHYNHFDLEGQFCEISNERKVTVRTHRDHGLNSVCTIIRITTEGAVGYNDGFQAPPVSTTGNFDIYLWDDTTLLEYMGDSNAPDAVGLESGRDLNITTTINEEDEIGILKVSFHATAQLRAGYDSDPLQTDPFKKLPQGRIVINFNRRDKYVASRLGFEADLGYTGAVYGTPFPVKCVAMNNMGVPVGQELLCDLYASNSDNYYVPSYIVVKNFNVIAKDQQFVEFHLLDIEWVRDYRNQGWVEFSAYELAGDGTETPVFEITRVLLDAQRETGVNNVDKTNVADHPIFDPNYVGSKLSLTFPVSIQSYIYQGDAFEITFPDMFVFPEPEDVSAVFRISKWPHTPADEYFFPAEVVMYKIIQQVHFFLPKTYNIYGCTNARPCSVNIVTSGFRHASFANPTPFDITVRVINKLESYQKFTYKNIPSPPVSSFNSLLATISSQFSENVYVDYGFSFTPSYTYPADSKIMIDMDYTKYRHIDKSYPKATCTTNFDDILKYCYIKEAQVEIELKGEMPEGFAAKITLKGVKNPKYIGQTASTDMRLRAIHPSSYLINEGYFNTLNYKAKKNVDTLFFKIELTSNYESVTSDYTFVLQNTNKLPAFGSINIELPFKWAKVLPDDVKISSLLGTFSKNKLIYSEKFIREPSGNLLLKITPEFEWPSKQPLRIKINQIINPIDLPLTEIFNAYTKYDSEFIDQSDPTDPDARIAFLPYEPKITMWKTDWSPRNEVEIADYTFRMSSADQLTKGQCIQFIFPDNYDSGITDYTKVMKCKSETIQFKACTYKDNVAQMCLDQDIPEDEQFDIVLEGVTNPNFGSSGAVDIATADAAGNILQFTNNVARFPSTEGPTPVPITKIEATSYDILVKADYDFCMEAPGDIPIDSIVIIDYPKQFDIRKSSYTCGLGANHDETNLPYGVAGATLACTVNNDLRRFEITGQTAAYTGAAPISLCYKIFEVENSKDTGESFNFIMRLYDQANKSMKYKTVGILDYPSTLSYKRSGLRIFTGDIPPIPAGTQSNFVEITLEKSVPYDVILTPQADGFRFEPETIDMKYYEGTTQKFRIIPLEGTEPGEHRITWVKQEDNGGGAPKFSEMPDSYFTLAEEPEFRQLRLEISQNVYRTPIDATSMPIYVELSHPATKPVTVYYKTKQPFQPEFVEFGPEKVTFQPGETVAQFNYKATDGAVSGLIELSLDPEFEELYYMPEDTINFEVEDKDLTPPNIVTTKQVSQSATSLNMRVSSDENTKVYYIASLRGTQPPPIEEMLDPAKRALSTKKPSTPEVQGNEHSKITKDTKTYVYHDTYIGLENLLPDTEYDLFMLPVDMYGNVGEMKKVEFETDPIPPPVTFDLKASSAMTDAEILNALSLVTAVDPSRFQITYKPNFSSIATGEQEVTDVLANSALNYEIKILPDPTGNGLSPFDLLKKIQGDSETLFSELPQLVKDQDVGITGKELFMDPQRFVYNPEMIQISNFDVTFNCSIQYTGTIYGIIQPKGDAAPSALQIRDGLTSQNFQVDSYYKKSMAMTVAEDKKYRVWPADKMNFDFLYHSTEYTAYFIADRIFEGETRLMEDSGIIAVTVKTERELFKVEDHVQIKKWSAVYSMNIGLLFLILLKLAW